VKWWVLVMYVSIATLDTMIDTLSGYYFERLKLMLVKVIVQSSLLD